MCVRYGIIALFFYMSRNQCRPMMVNSKLRRNLKTNHNPPVIPPVHNRGLLRLDGWQSRFLIAADQRIKRTRPAF
jgi:hypothetical protein